MWRTGRFHLNIFIRNYIVLNWKIASIHGFSGEGPYRGSLMIISCSRRKKPGYGILRQLTVRSPGSHGFWTEGIPWTDDNPPPTQKMGIRDVCSGSCGPAAPRIGRYDEIISWAPLRWYRSSTIVFWRDFGNPILSAGNNPYAGIDTDSRDFPVEKKKNSSIFLYQDILCW